MATRRLRDYIPVFGEEQADPTTALVFDSGVRGVGVIDFNAAGAAAMSVTINGVVYLEADAADAPNGVWTNGATAATSATSLAAAINGDTRTTLPGVTAIVSTLGDSVIVFADAVPGNFVVASSDGTATVEDLHEGRADAPLRVASVNYAVTAQDVLADEVNIPLPFVPTSFVVQYKSAAGAILENAGVSITALATIETTPDRIQVVFAGAEDLAAGEIVHVIAFE